MDIITRNKIMIENEYIIKAVIRRNMTLLKALRIAKDDAYQELSIAMLKALEVYDTKRSDSIEAYIWSKLRFAVLDMKRRHKPCGITGTGDNRLTFVSINYTYENGYAVDIPYEDDRSEIDLSDILSELAASEREALDMRMDGQYLKRKSQKENFSSACEKLLAMI